MTGRNPVCHQEVVARDGHLDACNQPATYLRRDPDGGPDYPVCKIHRERP